MYGLLAPKQGDTNPWLFPIAMANRGALHSDTARRWLYPKRTIWVDTTASTNGDGTHSRPLNKLAYLFEDDLLECVCQHLCADHITVRVKGAPMLIGTAGVVPNAPPLRLIEGANRDYNMRLLIRPWTNGARLSLGVTLRAHATSGQLGITFKQEAAVIQGLHGVHWLDTDMSIQLIVTCEVPAVPVPGQTLFINNAGIIGCMDTCHRSILQGCRLLVTNRVDAVKIQRGPDVAPAPPGLGVGGGIGGGDGGSGSPGSGGNYPWPDIVRPPNPTYPWTPPSEPTTPVIITPTVPPNAVAVVYGIKDSERIIVRDLQCQLIALAQSNVAGEARAYAIWGCLRPNLQHIITGTKAEALVKGYGVAYSNELGEGVTGYQMAATASATAIRDCRRAAVVDATGTTYASAIAEPGNLPYFQYTTGAYRSGIIGGSANAEAYGIAGCTNTSIQDTYYTVYATAQHPVSAVQASAPYGDNKGAVYNNATGQSTTESGGLD